MQFIKVKYIGKGDSILTEYDGIKYSFSKSKPIVEIPLIVYNHMQDYNNPHRESIVPYFPENEKVEKAQQESIDDDISNFDAVVTTGKKKDEDERTKGKSKRK